MNDQEKLPAELNQAIASIKPSLKRVVYIGVMVNLLSLAPTLYMLEVYDRVVNSRNHTTLLMLTLLVLGMYMRTIHWLRCSPMAVAPGNWP